MVIAPTTIEGGRQAFHEAWADGLRPTAVLAMSDATAIGALHAAREARIRVPDELSIVGFDDIDMARYTDPPLTTIHQPIHQKGEEAVRLLLREPVSPIRTVRAPATRGAPRHPRAAPRQSPAQQEVTTTHG